MHSLDRHLVIVKPKEPFLNWLKSHYESNNVLTLNDIREDATTFMIPQADQREQNEKYIRSIFPDLFDMLLEEWHLDENMWPKNRDYELFREWFELEIHTIVIDTVESSIRKDRFLS
ncbi:MAG: hypothetical protein ACM3MI_00580 [Clostridiales bacterium]